MPEIFSRRKGATTPPPTAIYVGRGTPWGNPFAMTRESERDAVCDQFEEYAQDRMRMEPDWLKPLRGRALVCWCAPKRCHAQTLLRLANETDEAE